MLYQQSNPKLSAPSESWIPHHLHCTTCDEDPRPELTRGQYPVPLIFPYCLALVSGQRPAFLSWNIVDLLGYNQLDAPRDDEHLWSKGSIWKLSSVYALLVMFPLPFPSSFLQLTSWASHRWPNSLVDPRVYTA